jgi:ribosomal protein S18 acetylase RimI-like enzyme
MAAAHPADPHWYLPWLAVAPALQGRGLGGQLLEDGLAIVDEDRLPAFLETPNPRTVPLYERHGFEVMATSQAGDCPPMTSMLRAAAA